MHIYCLPSIGRLRVCSAQHITHDAKRNTFRSKTIVIGNADEGETLMDEYAGCSLRSGNESITTSHNQIIHQRQLKSQQPDSHLV